MKTPDQIADEFVDTINWLPFSETTTISATALADVLAAAIRADRAQLLHGDADCRSCGHMSDCSTHNEPALPTEPCDCKRRTPATSASDRHDEARALLADWDAAAVPNVLGAHNAGGFALHESARIREVLRALAEPAAVNETANDAAMRIWGSRASVDLIIATRGHHPEVISLMERIWHAGLDAGWENWEPENAPGMVDTRATDVLDIVFDRLPDNVGANFIEVEDAHGASVKVGEWVTRPDGHAALRIEVVR